MLENILFINPLEEKIFISTFGEVRHSQYLDIPFLNFVEEFPEKISQIIKKYNISEIWIISGPGPFTKIRIITLAINSIKYCNNNIKLKSIHLFDILEKISDRIPIIQANKNEVLLRKNNNNIFEDIVNLTKNQYIGYLDQDIEDIDFEKADFGDISKLEKIFNNKKNEDIISPIYIKNPNITCQKK